MSFMAESLCKFRGGWICSTSCIYGWQGIHQNYSHNEILIVLKTGFSLGVPSRQEAQSDCMSDSPHALRKPPFHIGLAQVTSPLNGICFITH